MALSEGYKKRMKALSGIKGSLIESARVDFLKNEFSERIGRKYDRFALLFNDNRWDKHKESDQLILTMMDSGQLTKKGKLIPKDKFLKRAMDVIFPELENGDPSENKQYLKWLINIYLDGNLPEEDFYKIPETLALFHKNKEKLPINNRNANNYKTLADMYAAVLPFSADSEMSTTEKEKIIKLEGVKQVYEDADWKIITPITQEAACLYGKSTRWCTASSSNNMFNNYNRQGPLYILINKKEANERSPVKKLQFHFQSNQFMNTLDSSIEVRDFFVKNPQIKDFFKRKGEITPAFEFDHMLVTREEGLKLLKTTEDKLGLVKKKGFDFYKTLYREMNAIDVFKDSIINDNEFIQGIINSGNFKQLCAAYKENGLEQEAIKKLRKMTWFTDYFLKSIKNNQTEAIIEGLISMGDMATKFAAELCKYKGLLWNACIRDKKMPHYFHTISKASTFGGDGFKLSKKLISNPTVLKNLIDAGVSATQINLMNKFYNTEHIALMKNDGKPVKSYYKELLGTA